ncbi:MAG: LysM peptidoglycan-binding domain-containing protein [Bdellovibrionaceae bacterium]|nr:LysM peptidoglycan-binding domain-containing protein [Pseudobdellovibrionaceae bacterium]
MFSAPVWLLSCASNDNNNNTNDSGFATLGDGETASELDSMEAGADDLESADASDDMSELENEFEDMGIEEEAPTSASAQSEELEPMDNSGDADLDNLLDGGGEATPESFAENTETSQENSSWENVPMGSGPRSAVTSSSPQIPSEAFEKGGALLNRFYFSRKGDSWDSISQTLYGTREKSLSLQTWNGRRLRPGKLVYYESPSNRNDSNMVSYYEERGIRPEAYSLKRGESLSMVAQRQYGDGRSWKEIAGLNGIAAPDEIKVGTQLMLYPGSGGSDYSQNVAQAEPMPSTPEPEPAPQIAQEPSRQEEDDYSGFDSAPQPAVPPPIAQAPPPPVFNPPPPPVTSSSRQRFSTARMIQQNLFALAISGIVVVLLIALYVVNKRKKNSAMRQDGLLDEGFVPPRAGRR